MIPDLCADYNQVDDDSHLLSYLEDVVRAEHVVLGATVVVADPQARARSAIVLGISPTGVLTLDVDWSSRPVAATA